jgi:hypothetical protein
MDRQATEKSERELGDVTIVQKLGYARNAYNARRGMLSTTRLEALPSRSMPMALSRMASPDECGNG